MSFTVVVRPKFDNFITSIPLHQQYELNFIANDETIDVSEFHIIRFPFSRQLASVGITSIINEAHVIVTRLFESRVTNWLILVDSQSIDNAGQRFVDVAFKDINQALRFKLTSS